jgi:hypothetical protein
VKTRPHLLAFRSNRCLQRRPVAAGFRNLRVASLAAPMPSINLLLRLAEFALIPSQPDLPAESRKNDFPFHRREAPVYKTGGSKGQRYVYV